MEGDDRWGGMAVDLKDSIFRILLIARIQGRTTGRRSMYGEPEITKLSLRGNSRFGY